MNFPNFPWNWNNTPLAGFNWNNGFQGFNGNGNGNWNNGFNTGWNSGFQGNNGFSNTWNTPFNGFGFGGFNGFSNPWNQNFNQGFNWNNGFNPGFNGPTPFSWFGATPFGFNGFTPWGWNQNANHNGWSEFDSDSSPVEASAPFNGGFPGGVPFGFAPFPFSYQGNGFAGTQAA